MTVCCLVKIPHKIGQNELPRLSIGKPSMLNHNSKIDSCRNSLLTLYKWINPLTKPKWIYSPLTIGLILTWPDTGVDNNVLESNGRSLRHSMLSTDLRSFNKSVVLFLESPDETMNDASWDWNIVGVLVLWIVLILNSWENSFCSNSCKFPDGIPKELSLLLLENEWLQIVTTLTFGEMISQISVISDSCIEYVILLVWGRYYTNTFLLFPEFFWFFG